jgi:hypothetical protein
MDRPSQLPFKIHSFSTTHGEHTIARIQSFIAEHFNKELMIEAVARRPE